MIIRDYNTLLQTNSFDRYNNEASSFTINTPYIQNVCILYQDMNTLRYHHD